MEQFTTFDKIGQEVQALRRLYDELSINNERVSRNVLENILLHVHVLDWTAVADLLLVNVLHRVSFFGAKFFVVAYVNFTVAAYSHDACYFKVFDLLFVNSAIFTKQ